MRMKSLKIITSSPYDDGDDEDREKTSNLWLPKLNCAIVICHCFSNME